jgi:hypothetical protein
MMKRVTRGEANVVPLPGRDWHTYLGPENIATERISEIITYCCTREEDFVGSKG